MVFFLIVFHHQCSRTDQFRIFPQRGDPDTIMFRQARDALFIDRLLQGRYQNFSRSGPPAAKNYIFRVEKVDKDGNAPADCVAAFV